MQPPTSPSRTPSSPSTPSIASSVAGFFLTLAVFTLPVACDRNHAHTDPALTIGDAALLAASPFPGESGVATRREVIVRFTGSLRPASVTSSAIEVRDGDEVVPTRIHIPPSRDAVVLFPVDGWPTGKELSLRITDGKLLADSGRPIDADGDGRIGGSLDLPFHVVDLTRVPDTEVCGRVFASEPGSDGNDVPLAGVLVTVDGLENDCFAVTDALGNFCLQDAPAGDVFVHVRGSASTQKPAGFRYPDVGKAWHTVAGQRITVGTVFLPAVSEAALQPVSTTSPTTIRIVEDQLDRVADLALREQLSATEITVPADSLFADDGARGGSVGIAPVARDRLPGQLPPGLNLPLVITIQTDGPSNFDIPVPVKFPNLPDPITGTLLPPRAKSALWSFNHDTGRFEVVGPMTVSDDGLFVETDAGVGVRAPGWHGAASGTPGNASAPSGPPSDSSGSGGPCDSPSCCQGQCCDISIWDITADVARIAADLARCASEFTGILPLLGCVIDLVDAGTATFTWAIAIGEVVKNGATLQELINLKNETQTRLAAFVSIVSSCVLDQVVNKTAAIKDCAQRLLSRAEQLLNKYDECTSVIGSGAVGPLITRITGLLTSVNRFLNLIDTYLRDGIQQAAVQALQVLLEEICSITDASSLIGSDLGGADPTRPLTNAEIALVRSAADALSDTFEPIENGTFIADFAGGGYGEAVLVADEAAELAALVTNGIGIPIARTFAYAIKTPLPDATGVQRGSTTSQGTLQLLLPASADYLLHLYDPSTRRIGISHGTTAADGLVTTLRAPLMGRGVDLPDADADELPDDVEFVYGTDPQQADTDGDGVSDGDEVHSGSDPLDGVGGRVRLLADLPTVGPAVDLCADDGTMVTACGNAGIEVFNAWQNMDPTSVATLDTPGQGLRVACARLRVAVADGTAGLALIDLTTPAVPLLAHQVGLGDVRAVAAAEGIAVAGTQTGTIAIVGLDQGNVLAQQSVGAAIVDLQLDGEWVYALSDATLWVLRIQSGLLQPVTSLPLGRSNHRRLSKTDRGLLSVHWSGFVAIDVAEPTLPQVLAYTDTAQLGWRDLDLDGSGNAIAVVGPNNDPDELDDLRLYSLPQLGQPGSFVRDFTGPDFPDFEPGTISAAVIYNGLAYATDRRGRLFCARYRLRDLGAAPPTVDLDTGLANDTIEEGRVLQLRAATGDDVQVAYVDFELDGQRLVSDGSYPFELRLVAPPLANGATRTLGAKCWDTGGNLTQASTVELSVTPDLTPPSVVRSTPDLDGFALAGEPARIVVVFDERMAIPSLHTGSLLLAGAGPDGELATADDEPVVLTSAQWLPELQAAIWNSTTALSEQRYLAHLSGPTDVAGNPLPIREWAFTANSGLRTTWFAAVDSTAVGSFFAGQTPLTVTEYRAGTPARQLTSSVVPNVAFPGVNGGAVIHTGPDGAWSSSSVQSPTGDDIAWATPDVVGVLLEGTLLVPASGTVQFSLLLDDFATLEVDGQIVLQRFGCQAPSTFLSAPVQLPAGPVSFRLAASDACGATFACVLQATGGGFPAGILPPSVFASGN